ncbi:MAG: PRC-barrel domain containing protein [Opitutaceae bacterium]|nr:PRC-barrel domain containing protein [Verrucomicrobiales bacterium]
MFRSIQQLYGYKLFASDGEVGTVTDCYFDDHNWAVRYLVVDPGSRLPGRQVLISPHSLSRLSQDRQVMWVGLTRKQIRNSPSIQSPKQVSRQFEEEYCRYYGLPCYWQGEALWGMGDFPILEGADISLPDQPLASRHGRNKPAETNLLSTQAVIGCRPRVSDDSLGQFRDFMIDLQSWAIRQVVVKAGSRCSTAGLGIPTSRVDRISWEKSSMVINLTQELVE